MNFNKSTITTIGDIAKSCCLNPRALNSFRKKVKAMKDYRVAFPHSYRSGRSNYIAIQELLDAASDGTLKYGGQGKSAPDFWLGEKWGETKSFEPGKTTAHVAASAYFASNSKVPKHRKLLRENPIAAKQMLFEDSYDKNDVYCLTGTGKNDSADPEDIEVIFVSKELLVSCLTSTSNFKEVDLKLLRSKILTNP